MEVGVRKEGVGTLGQGNLRFRDILGFPLLLDRENIFLLDAVLDGLRWMW